MEAGIRVDGARKLRTSMRRAAVDIEQLRDTHARVAAMVAGAGRATAPRRTGRLAGTVRSSGTNTAATVRAGYARVPYALPIHWGWPRRGITAQPWLSQAAQETEPAWFGVYTSAVQDILDRVKGV